jgi:translation initiation factor IF-1
MAVSKMRGTVTEIKPYKSVNVMRNTGAKARAKIIRDGRFNRYWIKTPFVPKIGDVVIWDEVKGHVKVQTVKKVGKKYY